MTDDLLGRSGRREIDLQGPEVLACGEIRVRRRLVGA